MIPPFLLLIVVETVGKPGSRMSVRGGCFRRLSKSSTSDCHLLTYQATDTVFDPFASSLNEGSTPCSLIPNLMESFQCPTHNSCGSFPFAKTATMQSAEENEQSQRLGALTWLQLITSHPSCCVPIVLYRKFVAGPLSAQQKSNRGL